MSKTIVKTVHDAIKAAGITGGMTISFHHHLRNGDRVMEMILDACADMGIKDLTVAASSVFPAQASLVGHMRAGVVTGLETSYMSGPVAQAVTRGELENPVVFRSHGGRAQAIDSGQLKIDAAFIAAPSVDAAGNIDGANGPAACGSLGYPAPDAANAAKVVAVTDNLMQCELERISIPGDQVDMILTVDSIGDPAGIVSGTTKITRDPVSLVIARLAADLIEASGLIKDDFRFQTGAGGISLAAAKFVREKMRAKGVTGDYLLGGITGYLVDMLEEGLFKRMFDVQCFDLKAVESLRKNVNHMEITASQYASPDVADSYAGRLDTVLLGATEIDTNFNVNVHTDSNGLIIGGSGGHSDTAAGAKLTVIVAPLVRARLPIVVDKVLTVSTPGNTVDALVTEHGIAVNPANTELTERLADSGLPLTTIGELRQKALSMTGIPKRVPMTDTVVGRVLYRDGSEIDAIHTPEA